MKFTTPHLSYEHGFVSIIQSDQDDIPCGKILETGANTCAWPFEAPIEEPDWFFDEVCDLISMILDKVDSLQREDDDYMSQVKSDYLRGKGAK
jgi:hypothetical protein